jgi:class 3 adenylate cyclase
MNEGFLEISLDTKTRCVPLEHRTVIGRSTTNEVALPNDLLVSRTHAVIEQYAGGWVVRDLGAANGTFVNGVRVIVERVLHPGDEIRVGDSVLVFQSGAPSDARSTLVVERREHAVILFTDIVGSTEQAMATSPEVAGQLRRRHFLMLRQAIFDSDGIEIKTLGDGIMASFPSSSAAVACAVAMQEAIDRDNRANGTVIGLRVGVSCGEAIRDTVDYFGPVVVEASRLCALADGGQILVSDALRVAARHRAVAPFRELGAMDLKGFAEAVVVHEVAWKAQDER